MSDTPRILIVGAGAVGQVYGAHLARGGAEVGALVRPRYARAATAGFDLQPARDEPWRWVPTTVFTEPDEIVRQRWDQVWLCVSSPALRGAWLGSLLEAARDATIVSLQPGLDDRALLLERVPEERLVSGLIAYLAWLAPLPGQTGPKGMAYWFPPFAKSRFSGPEAAVDLAVDTLQRGGCPASRSRDVSRESAQGSAVLLTTIAALEVAGWTFRTWRGHPVSRLGAAAAREALAIAAAYHGARPGPIRWLAKRGPLALLSRLAPLAMPLPVETYLRVHFTKVGDQTREALRTWIAAGAARGLQTEALTRLLEQLPPA